jgi:hypothetical protein
MATVTPNFNWPVPTSTDLVKDGATAIEALGDSIDASLVDLKGGTTGQVLSKNSNTDMDFTWVTDPGGDITGVTAGTGISGGGTSGTVTVTNSMATTITTKGDLVPGTGSGTFARLAAGSNGETLVADSSTSTGLRYQGNFAAGKNAIINGDFNIWQRGTTFTNPAGASYTTDRWRVSYLTAAPTTYAVSRETFTPGSEPVSGYNSPFFWRGVLTTVGTNTGIDFQQRIENVYTFANTTVTFSFYAKSDSNRTQTVNFQQNFGSGGSSTIGLTAQTINTTSSWQRFSLQFSIPSTSGKTIGANSYLQATISQNLTNGNTLDIWGVQVEAGSVATAFQTATGTIQGELAACQRYYFRSLGSNVYSFHGTGAGITSTRACIVVQPPVTMRTTPSGTIDFGNVAISDAIATTVAVTSIGWNNTENPNNAVFDIGVASSLIASRPYWLINNNNAAGFIGFSAEL